jgi:hypothetical protein
VTIAEHIVESLLGENIDPRLAEVCARKLAEIGKFEQAKLLKYSENVAELHSYLRDRVFGKDSTTADFVKQCQDELRANLVPAMEGIGSKHQPVRLRTPDGQTVIGDFSGYYDFGKFGHKLSIGYPLSDGSLTHGVGVPAGYTLLSPIPSFEEWKASEEEAGAPSKAAFWPTSGSGA